jgi:hypothetical protein
MGKHGKWCLRGSVAEKKVHFVLTIMAGHVIMTFS